MPFIDHDNTAQHPPWMDKALCLETDPDVFFPEQGQPTLPAKRICAKCEVRAECLIWALDHHERYGIWGGKSPKERGRMRVPRVA